jgi:phosphonate transport system permease protein
MTGYPARLTDSDIAAWRRAVPRAYARPLTERLGLVAAWATFMAVLVMCLWHLDFAPQRLWQGVWKLGWLLPLMFPPWHGGWLGEFSYAMLQTLAMAFLGTVLASLAALPLGFLGARNVVPQWLFHFGLRCFFDSLRGVDALLWALMFVNVVGLGPFAGVMAIAVSDTGTLSKLFAEAIEHVDGRQIEGVRASGANHFQVMRFAILPQSCRCCSAMCSIILNPTPARLPSWGWWVPAAAVIHDQGVQVGLRPRPGDSVRVRAPA